MKIDAQARNPKEVADWLSEHYEKSVFIGDEEQYKQSYVNKKNHYQLCLLGPEEAALIVRYTKEDKIKRDAKKKLNKVLLKESEIRLVTQTEASDNFYNVFRGRALTYRTTKVLLNKYKIADNLATFTASVLLCEDEQKENTGTYEVLNSGAFCPKCGGRVDDLIDNCICRSGLEFKPKKAQLLPDEKHLINNRDNRNITFRNYVNPPKYATGGRICSLIIDRIDYNIKVTAGGEQEKKTHRQYMYTADPLCNTCGKILTTQDSYDTGICSDCGIDKVISEYTGARTFRQFISGYQYGHYKYIKDEWLTFDAYWEQYQGREYWKELKQEHHGEKYWKGLTSLRGKYDTLPKQILYKYDSDWNLSLVSGIKYNKTKFDNIELTNVRYPALNRIPCFRLDCTMLMIDGCFTTRNAPYYKSEIEAIRDWKPTETITHSLIPHKWTPAYTDESETERLVNLRKDMTLADDLFRKANTEDNIRTKEPKLILPENWHPFPTHRHELINWDPDDGKYKGRKDSNGKYIGWNISMPVPLIANLADNTKLTAGIIKHKVRDENSERKLQKLHNKRYTNPEFNPEFNENDIEIELVKMGRKNELTNAPKDVILKSEQEGDINKGAYQRRLNKAELRLNLAEKPTSKRTQRRQIVLQINQICSDLNCAYEQLRKSTVLQHKAIDWYRKELDVAVNKQGLRAKFLAYERKQASS